MGDTINIEAIIWKIEAGKITELKHNNNVFVLKEPETPMEIIAISSSPEKPKKSHVHNFKKSYLEKWIKSIDYDVFTLEQFYKEYPLQQKNRHLSRNISRLISDKKLIQLGKNKFKVV